MKAFPATKSIGSNPIPSNNLARSNGGLNTGPNSSRKGSQSVTISGANMGPGTRSNEITPCVVSNSPFKKVLPSLVDSNLSPAAALPIASGGSQELEIQLAASQGAASSNASTSVLSYQKQEVVDPAQSGVIPVVEDAKASKEELLYLSGWNLTSIPDAIVNSKFIRLVLSNNSIKACHVNSFFLKQLPKLEVLDLSHNELSDSFLELDGTSFPNVHTITLNNCSISKINFSNFNNLKYLDVSFNKNIVITFNDSVPSSLKVLNLNGCELGDDAINTLFSSRFESLNCLYLFGNKLANVEFLEKCPVLTELDLSSNSYESFAINHQDRLKYLGRLCLKHNQIKTIKLTGLSKLTYLDLSHNQLRMSVNKELNKKRFDLTGAPKLSTLVLSNNPLTFVDDLFPEAGFQHLAQLYMSVCNLGSFNLPSNQQLSSLTYLDLSSNKIKCIDCQKFPTQFFDIKMTLDISGNTGIRFINTNDYYTKSVNVINFQDALLLHQVNQRLHIANINTTKELNQLQFKVLKNAKPLILSMSKRDQDFVEKLFRFYKELDAQLSELPGQINKNPHEVLPSSDGTGSANIRPLVAIPTHTAQPNVSSSDNGGSNGPDQAQPALHHSSAGSVDPQPQDTQANGSVDSVSENAALAVDEQKINESKKMLMNIKSDLEKMVNYVFMHYTASDVAKTSVQLTIGKISSQIITGDYKPVVQTIIKCMVAYYLEAVVFKDTRDAFQGVSGQNNLPNNKPEDNSDKSSTPTPRCFTVLCLRFSRAQSNKSLDELAKKINRIFSDLKLIHNEMDSEVSFSFESFFKSKHSPQGPSSQSQSIHAFFSDFFIEQMKELTIDETSKLSSSNLNDFLSIFKLTVMPEVLSASLVNHHNADGEASGSSLPQQIGALKKEPLVTNVLLLPQTDVGEGNGQNGASQPGFNVIESDGASSFKRSSVDARSDSGNVLANTIGFSEDVEAGATMSLVTQGNANASQHYGNSPQPSSVESWPTVRPIEGNGAAGSESSGAGVDFGDVVKSETSEGAARNVKGEDDAGSKLSSKLSDLREEDQAGAKESLERQGTNNDDSQLVISSQSSVKKRVSSIEGNGVASSKKLSCAESSSKLSDSQNSFAQQTPHSDGDVEGITHNNSVAAAGSVKGEDNAESNLSSPRFCPLDLEGSVIPTQSIFDDVNSEDEMT